MLLTTQSMGFRQGGAIAKGTAPIVALIIHPPIHPSIHAYVRSDPPPHDPRPESLDCAPRSCSGLLLSSRRRAGHRSRGDGSRDVTAIIIIISIVINPPPSPRPPIDIRPRCDSPSLRARWGKQGPDDTGGSFIQMDDEFQAAKAKLPPSHPSMIDWLMIVAISEDATDAPYPGLIIPSLGDAVQRCNSPCGQQEHSERVVGGRRIHSSSDDDNNDHHHHHHHHHHHYHHHHPRHGYRTAVPGRRRRRRRRWLSPLPPRTACAEEEERDRARVVMTIISQCAHGHQTRPQARRNRPCSVPAHPKRLQ